MKKRLLATMSVVMVGSMLLAGCGKTEDAATTKPAAEETTEDGSVAKSPEYVIERHFPFLEKRKLAENLCTLIFCQFFSHLNKAFIFCWNFRLTLL